MATLPGQFDFQLWKGATYRTSFTVYSDAAGTQLRDLTGYTASLTIIDPSTGSTLLSLTDGNAGLILGGNLGTIQAFVSAAATAALSWSTGIYQLVITAPNGGDTDALTFGTVRVESY